MQKRKDHQPSTTVDEQIVNLRVNGLIIRNEDYARSFLSYVSYFRLIKAYSLGLKEQNGKYKENVCFEDIVDLYLFNTKFRQFLLVEVEKVEVSLRCRLSNYFCEKYGVFGYENIDNFAVSSEVFAGFYGEINKEIARNARSPFVRNFQDNYIDSKIPLYALVELLSFGTLSKFFKNMKNKDKKAVAGVFCIGYTYFESWIESMAYVRNICAHYGRLYNNRLIKKPKMYKQYSKIWSNRIFTTLMTIKHILPNDQNWNDFIKSIEFLIEKYPRINLQMIGFPQEWTQYLR
jgi:abortive infection bacteriophage resistance protein